MLSRAWHREGWSIGAIFCNPSDMFSNPHSGPVKDISALGGWLFQQRAGNSVLAGDMRKV